MLAVVAALLVPVTGWAQMRPQPRQQQAPPPPSPSGEVTERLVMTPPVGWTIGGSSVSQNALTKQMFPPGQTAETWNEMMSIQIMADARADPREHIQRIVEASRTNCEASGPSPVTEAQTNGYPVATLTVTCTKGRQSGMGGLVAVKAIRGGSALYVIQRIWRGQPFERNEIAPVPSDMLQEWSAFLRNVSVCDSNDPTRHPCPK
ncbi:hypothetical protein CU669_06150 [Paramagnetospirillum kuznetsovii]|uniref:Uncharacterized protein n=2 Tax=Paramagnetospirillum kuznetsovii TaxID=2053833 RepID=A0A364P195_9PROT|nr:hypothetical protein CU669_06150 [Paramagnetospirillum kuznetsovii]